MVDLVESFFSQMVMPDPLSYKLAMDACQLIYSSDGTVTVKELVDHFGVSRQRLNREFRSSTKYNLKEFSMLVKVRALMTYRQQDPHISLTDLAHRFGYYDQSHFIQDIRRASGVSPRVLFSMTNFVKEQWPRA